MAITTTLAIDCMGGDFGPSTLVQAACLALSRHPELSLYLVGDEQQIKQNLSSFDQLLLKRIKIVHTDVAVAMDDQPSRAIRQKTDSSMAMALQLVADGKAQAIVSAGNTGALMAFSRKILSMIPGISRPAILSSLPTSKGTSWMIDLGANVDCSPEQLMQFAQMGAAIAQANNCSLIKPGVALVNIGSESIKGNEQVRQTHELLMQAQGIDYRGFIEGNQVFVGDVDVIVCDGFVGNVLIKASEGVVHMVIAHLQKQFRKNLWTRLVAGLSASVLKSFQKIVNPDQHNGASLVGLQGVVVKSHGAANVAATLTAIEEARREANYDTPARIQQRLASQATETAED